MELSFKTQPYAHQREAVARALTSNELGLFFEMGAGKTKCAIDIIRHQFNSNRRKLRTLILGPVAVLYNWKHEIKLHSNIPLEDVHVADGTGSKRVAAVQDFCFAKGSSRDGIVIVNYEALARAKPMFETIKTWEPEIIICDESHMLKNHQAEQTKRVTALADKAKYRYILTGTPILNSPIDVFSQFRILDLGETFGTNFFVFRSTYFHDANERWAGRPGHFPKYLPRPSKFPELSDLIAKKSMRILKKDCLDLPPRIEQTVVVRMTKPQSKAYAQMKNEFMAWVENQRENKTEAAVATTAMTKALRLMQIASGFVTTEEGTVVDLGANEKLELVEQYLTELTPEHKVILWCCFKHNYKQLAQVCTKLGVKHVFITGEQSAKEKQDSVNSFASDPDVRVVIANRRAGGTGINLTQASYSIVFSRNFSLAEELQSMDRNHRGGSQIHEKIVKIDLVTEDTVELKVLEAIQNKHDVSTQIIDFIKGA
jgi:SNF2 family DNA or RNA helicase